MKREIIGIASIATIVLMLGVVAWSDNQPVITPPKGAQPGGSVGTIQYKATSSTFGGIAGSSWNGTSLVLPGVSFSSPTVSNGTALYVPYLDASKNLVTDVNMLKWDATGKCFSAGNYSCSYFFDIRQSINGGNVGAYFNNTHSGGQSKLVLYNDAGHQQYISNVGTGVSSFYADQLLIFSDTNVGYAVTGGTVSVASADLAVITAGKTLRIAGGTNAKHGTFTLSSGAAFVSNTSITENSVIIPTIKTVSGTVTTITVSSTTVGGGFNVAGAVTDNSTYNYAILEKW